MEARGVETDPSLVTRAAESSLDVALGDSSAYLRELKDRSLGGLTLIQVIEHLEFLSREAGFADVEIDGRNPPPDTDQLRRRAGDDESTREVSENLA